MATTLASLRSATARRLGDLTHAIWSVEELDRHLTQAYDVIAQQQRVFWDWVYSENLPSGFSYTQAWEKDFLDRAGLFDYGCANYTAPFEKDHLPEDELIGPANHTCPDEISHLSAVGASTAVSATDDVPETLTELARATWDNRGIEALSTREMRALDSRYRDTEGDVYGLLWEFDGLRTIRKVRVPAAMADTFDCTGAWGLLRDCEDLTSAAVTGTFGIPRIVPSQHPLGWARFGTPRRVYSDGKNVRLEHWRQGRPMVADADLCELPDRYALYLRDYAQAECYRRRGPGQDLALAQHFDQRWQRDLTRIAARQRVVVSQRLHVMGGSGRTGSRRPPAPVLPWNYGQEVR